MTEEDRFKIDLHREVFEFNKQLEQKIVNSILTKEDKLRLISRYGLWGTVNKIPLIFGSTIYGKELKEKCLRLYGHEHIKEAIYTEYHDRYTEINIIEDILSDVTYNKNHEICVLRHEYWNSISKCENVHELEEVYLDKQEVIDIIVDYCLSNKVINFMWDW